MGGVISKTGRIVSSAASMLDDRSSNMDYYNTLAADADRQAAYTADAAKRQNTYLLKSAAERNKEVYDDFRQTAGQQKTLLAASGLTSNSATVQTILKNSRFNALLDEESLQQSLKDAIDENDLAAAERIRNLNITASQYRQASRNRGSKWKLGSQFLSLFD